MLHDSQIQQLSEASGMQELLAHLSPEGYSLTTNDVRASLSLEEPRPLSRFVPDLPRLDGRFTHNVRPQEPSPNRPSSESLVDLLHVMITDVELVSIEICARAIVEGGNLPWEFTIDMARQSWDEARHSQPFASALAKPVVT